MRNIYMLLGVLFLVLTIGSVYAFNQSLKGDISNITSISMTETITLTSRAFDNDETIPPKYTCDGDNISPELLWSGVPEGTKTLALIVDDPDVPKQLKSDGVFDHWTLFNVSPETSGIPEGGTAGTVGANGVGKRAYTGPCPPPQYAPSEHRYFFRLYALDTELTLDPGASKQEVLAAMEGHVLAQGELMGKYKRVATGD